MSDYIYENGEIMKNIVNALRPILKEGEKIIWRRQFRWHDDNGVLPNHFEGRNIESLCEEFNYELIHNLIHIAVIKPIAPLEKTNA